MKRYIILGLCTLALILSVPVRAQEPYDPPWSSVDNGGGGSAGSVYTLYGTIGQPDAGRMSGSTYTLNGGFWPGRVMIVDGKVIECTIYLPLIVRN